MLAVSNLSYERYFEPIFEPVSFTLGSGSLLLVTGPNGCGKTTLLRLLAGLLDGSEVDLQRQANPLFIGHHPAIKDDLSVRENIRFMMDFMGRRHLETGQTDKKLLQQIIVKVGLESVSNQEGRTLSAGQRKRCSLARLLFCDEPLWLLDEPYSNLDQDGVALLDDLLKEHLNGGGSCVMTAHGSLRPAGLDMQEYSLRSGHQQPGWQA